MNRLFPLIGLFIALGLAFAYVEPTYANEISKLSDAIAGVNKALDAAKTYKAKENQLVQERDDIPPENLKNLETLLPSSVNNIIMILDLNALASRSNVVLSDVNVSPPPAASIDQNEGPVGSVDLTITANGSYAAFRTFLEGIERSARILDVEHLLIHGTDTGVYEYTLTLRLYWLR